MDPYSETQETWNKVAGLYQDNFMHLSIYNHTYDVLCDTLSPHARLFEIGCGPGNITNYILTKRPDIRVDAIDSSEEMIKLARKNNPSAQFTVMDCRAIGVIDKQYDAIVCGFCLPYLSEDDCTQLFNHCKQKLVANGILYLSFVEGDVARSGYQTGSSGHRLYFYYHRYVSLLKQLERFGFIQTHFFEVPYTQKDGKVEQHSILICSQ